MMITTQISPQSKRVCIAAAIPEHKCVLALPLVGKTAGRGKEGRAEEIHNTLGCQGHQRQWVTQPSASSHNHPNITYHSSFINAIEKLDTELAFFCKFMQTCNAATSFGLLGKCVTSFCFPFTSELNFSGRCFRDQVNHAMQTKT